MQETAHDLSELQRLLDASHLTGGEHLRSAFDQEHPPTATRVADALTGVFEMHLAVVTSDGAPLGGSHRRGPLSRPRLGRHITPGGTRSPRASLYIERYGDWFGPWMDERDRVNGPGITGYVEPCRMFAKG